MFLEQIIKFELRGPGPLVVHVLLNWLFLNKHLQGKSSRELLFTSKNFAGGNLPSFPLSGPSQLQNLTKKCKNLNVFMARPV